MTDLMIDLETLGTDPETPVISLGAVFFNPTTKVLGPTFYMVMDVEEQIARGRKPTGSTIKWWMGQKDAAKKVFHEKSKPVADVLNLFTGWYKSNSTGKRGSYVWGNGSSFDISIMENIYKDYGLEYPWSQYNIMDLRTFRRFIGDGDKIKKGGVNHNALDDAVAQAQYVMEKL